MFTLAVAALLALHAVRETHQSYRAYRAVAKHVTHYSERQPSAGAAVRAANGEMRTVESSRNKESLASMLDGAFLLRWASRVTHAIDQANENSPAASVPRPGSPFSGVGRYLRGGWWSSNGASDGDLLEPDGNSEEPIAPVEPMPEDTDTFKAALETFMVLEKELLNVDVDMTHYSEEPQARVMRKLTEIEGFVDFLSCCKEDGRQGLVSPAPVSAYPCLGLALCGLTSPMSRFRNVWSLAAGGGARRIFSSCSTPTS
eukprot:3941713-Rhodomonas_salina.1